MTDKELQKLKRVELLEMLIQQSREVEELKKRLEETEKKLQNREMMINQAGSIAEASLMLNGVFDAAQAAASQYLENIQTLSGRQQEVCQALEKETREKCDLMLKEAEEAVQQRWEEISSRLEAFYNAHQGLREIIALVGGSLDLSFGPKFTGMKTGEE